MGWCGCGQYEPYILELDEATRYVWCQCGVSMKQPFCDANSHRSTPLLVYLLAAWLAVVCVAVAAVDVCCLAASHDASPPLVHRPALLSRSPRVCVCAGSTRVSLHP